ncbi:hypothetical protein EVAR_103241_1 [Eumeta japonica]|uniref:C-type lectin domain-containing protein n=1 Tax=Eumeta variegata TaxID=151549 RepID=A0A4C1XAG4_EUMVA|nr:hypothetical protein EVAR_103241_1 [Eumeta japonica]
MKRTGEECITHAHAPANAGVSGRNPLYHSLKKINFGSVASLKYFNGRGQTAQRRRVVFDNDVWHSDLAEFRHEDCGVIEKFTRNGYDMKTFYKTENCTARLRFVCEMDTKLEDAN